MGDTPVRNSEVSSWYAAVGVNVNIAVFNGFLFTAKSREASLRARAAQERLRDVRDRIARDVRTSWLNAKAAHQRLDVTQQLLEQANLALNFAQSRYKLGLGSIVELSQAQLQQTQAQIANAQPDTTIASRWQFCGIRPKAFSNRLHSSRMLHGCASVQPSCVAIHPTTAARKHADDRAL